MLAALLSAGAVLGAEAAVRTRINRAPDGTYPRMLTKHIQLRRAHNRGLVGSRMEAHPAVVYGAQTAATAIALGAAVLVHLPVTQAPFFARLGSGLLVGGALANTGERYARHHVTDYLYLKDSRIPLLRKRIWNLADAAIFNGAVMTAAGILLGGVL